MLQETLAGYKSEDEEGELRAAASKEAALVFKEKLHAQPKISITKQANTHST